MMNFSPGVAAGLPFDNRTVTIQGWRSVEYQRPRRSARQGNFGIAPANGPG